MREEQSGPRAAIISSLSEKSLEHEAAPPVLPLACLHSLRHTQLFLLLLSCFPLRPPRSLASYLMMLAPLWGVEPRSLPGGSPSNLQASSIEATLRLPDQHQTGAVTCWEEDSSPQRLFFSSSPLLMIRQKEDHLKSESVAHFTRLHHPLLGPRLHTHTHSTVPGHTAKATRTCIERGRDRKMGKHKIICLAAFFFFFFFGLSCLAGEQQCSLLPYAGTHYMQAHTHSFWQQVRTHTQRK